MDVPGVVLLGSRDGQTWKEIPFRYALGAEGRRPRRTAPHQPRLDWQMWCATARAEALPISHYVYIIRKGD